MDLQPHHGARRRSIPQEPSELRSPKRHGALTRGDRLSRDRVCSERVDVHHARPSRLWTAAVVEQGWGREHVVSLQSPSGHRRCGMRVCSLGLNAPPTCCREPFDAIEDVVTDGVWPPSAVEGVGNQGEVDVTGQQFEVLQGGGVELPRDNLWKGTCGVLLTVTLCTCWWMSLLGMGAEESLTKYMHFFLSFGGGVTTWDDGCATRGVVATERTAARSLFSTYTSSLSVSDVSTNATTLLLCRMGMSCLSVHHARTGFQTP